MSKDKAEHVSKELPTGTVTFLLTDVEGSTVLWEERPDAMRRAMSRHHRIVHDSIDRYAGALPRDQGEGDSVLGAFSRATDAVAAALDIQRDLAAEDWPESLAIAVRAAIHTGEIELRDGNYFGVSLNRCARLRGIAHGGQTLVSQATRDIVGNGLPARSHFKSLGTHRLKDLAVPENVYELVSEEDPQEFPPLRSLDALPNNLPVQLTLLIGRDKEVREVEKLVLSNRLVTLTGAGGCGKTRLALQTSAEILENFPDGAWFVDLAAISDPELVPLGFAKGLGLKTETSLTVDSKIVESPAIPPESIIQRLKDFIHDRRMLLIVDNCEHLLSVSAEIIDSLLRGSASLKVLSTTREPLGVAGEATYRVPSLTVPDAKHAATPEELQGYEAIRLFLHRASLVHDQFALTPENSSAIVQICRRLDGIPLAIELAAARVRSLGPEQIAARLDDQFRLLTGGSRTALERQQTLRAAVDWSYQLLSEQERRLLTRLSVFGGGFTLEAAEEICADENLAGHEVLDLVDQLVEKSLVAWDSEGLSARYRQLETIRQYAREKLLESGEGSTVRTRHRNFFMELAEKARVELEGRNVAEWLQTLDLENDNLRAALEWSLSDDDPEPGIRIAGGLSTYWDVRGYGTEARTWLDLVLAKEGDVAPALKSRALQAATRFARGNATLSQRYVDEAIELARLSGDDSILARAMIPLGMTTFWLKGDFGGALSVIEEAALLAHSAGDTYGEGLCTYLLGDLSATRGDYQQAREFLESSLSLGRAMGTPLGIARSLLGLAGIARRDRSYSKEKEMLEEALALARQTGDTESILVTLVELSRVAGIQGDGPLSSELWEKAALAVRESGDVEWLQFLGRSALLSGSFAEAHSIFKECVTRYREIGADAFTAGMLNNSGWSAYMMGDLETAHSFAKESVSMFRVGGHSSVVGLGLAMHSLGEISRARGDLEGAVPYLEQSIEIARGAQIKEFEVTCLLGLAAVNRAQSNVPEAASLLHESVTIARQMDEAGMVAEVLQGVGGLMADQRRSEDATTLISAADFLRELGHSPVGAVARAEIDEDLNSLRAQLEPDIFAKAWEEGQSLDIQEALRLAERVLDVDRARKV